MGDPKSESSKTELEALHRALVRARREAGTLDSVIPVPEWEGILAQALSVMTRQTANDKTWAMQRLGLIEHTKRVGVRILDKSRSNNTNAQSQPA